MSRKLLPIAFGAMAISGRVTYYIVTPLWLDHFSGNSTQENGTLQGNGTADDTRRINPMFIMLWQWSICSLVFGLGWLVIRLFLPSYLGEADNALPKRDVIIVGIASGVSTVLFNFSMSGTRTPLYLQAILSNCTIPIQFTIRFLLLRRRSTRLKLACATVIALCEFVCLIPSIFPQLEPEKDHRAEGGSTGVWKFLWPMFMVLSQVPFAVANSLMERSVQGKQGGATVVVDARNGDIQTANGYAAIDNDDSEVYHQLQGQGQCQTLQGQTLAEQAHGAISQSRASKEERMNLVVFLFWWCFICLLTVVALFWTDILPTFGTSSDVEDFAKTIRFNILCLSGHSGCGPDAYMLALLNFFATLVGNVAFAGLMRYSEGANFVIILLTMRTPLVFLFWTLFQESPFKLAPHAYLSTWLSIGAIAVMIPCVIIYDLSRPATTEVDVRATTATPGETRDRLCDSEEPSGYHNSLESKPQC